MPVLPVFRPLRDALVGARSSRTRSLLSRPLLSCPLLSRCGIPGPGFCGGSVRRRRVSARSSTVRAFPAFCPCLAAAPFVRFGRSGPTALLGPRFAGRSGKGRIPPLAGRGDLRMYLQVKPICVSEKIINIFRNFYCYSFHKNKSFSTFVPSDSAHTEVRRATLEREWISN